MSNISLNIKTLTFHFLLLLGFFLHLKTYFSGSETSTDSTNYPNKNFNTYLTSSYQFTLQAAHLLKLKSILAEKIKNKTNRMLQAIGLNVESTTTTKKKMLRPTEITVTDNTSKKTTNIAGKPICC